MNGILLVDKEKGVTSRDVVNEVAHFFNTKKVGHTGTLDPIATGVLVICLGNCTKLVEILSGEEKEYIATIKLGIKTDTGDITGNVIEKKDYSFMGTTLERVLKSFVGEITQTVPIYSAVKVNGKKLYQYARNNEKVELPKRKVLIKSIELIDFKDDEITFKTSVSKGTYIRSLIEDICTKLNTVGTMRDLRRTRQGNYKIDDCFTIDEIKSKNYKIISKEEVLTYFETYILNDEEFLKIKNGAVIPKNFKTDYCVFKYQKKVVAIYQTYHRDESLAKPFKMFVEDI